MRDNATKQPTVALIRTTTDAHPVFYRLEPLCEDEIADLPAQQYNPVIASQNNHEIRN